MILVTMPIYNAPELAGKSIQSCGENLFLVCNTSDERMRKLMIGRNGINLDQNMGCNFAWNLGMDYFLKGKWDWLAIGSSDVILHKGWVKVLKSIKPTKEVYVPTYSPSLEIMKETKITKRTNKQEIKGGVAGAFMFLPRKAVELVFPIPKELYLWFGDEWIFTILRRLNWKVKRINNLYAFHFPSTGVSATPNFVEIIKRDKKFWAENAERLIQEKIK